MRVIGHDMFSRGGARPANVPRIGLTTVLLIFTSLTLLVLDRLDHPVATSTRQVLDRAVSPVLETVMEPTQPLRSVGRDVTAMFELGQELDRLRTENQQLLVWRHRAMELERQIAVLERIAKAVPAPGRQFVTARVLSQPHGPLSQVAMINAGTQQGVREGYPALDADGLVGRVVTAGSTSSRLLLVTDADSRIPVLVGDREVRAIMQGDGSATPTLAFLPPHARVEVGDTIQTSGVGGFFPRGLFIGRIETAGSTPRVKPAARVAEVEIVSILFHTDHMPAEVRSRGIQSPSAATTDRPLPEPGRRKVRAQPGSHPQ